MEENNNNKINDLIGINSNPYLNRFIKEQGLDNSFVMDNYLVFKDSLDSLKKCEHCKGLATCTQSKKGEILSVAMNPILTNEITYCEYYKKELIRQKMLKSYVYSDIPEIYSLVSLKNIELDEDDAKNLFVRVYQLYEGKTQQGFYIYGDLGVGKTYMCIALANSLVMADKKVAFIKTNNFVTEMANLNRTDPERYTGLLNKIRKAEYLFLDDIGSEIVTEFVRDRLLIDLLDYRMENKLCTIFTSNLDKEALLRHYGNNQESIKAKRLMERIDILSENFCLKGTNKRRISK